MLDVSTIEAAVTMVNALMDGDESTFKAGYSFENAVLAVADISEFDADEIENAWNLDSFDAYHRFIDSIPKHERR